MTSSLGARWFNLTLSETSAIAVCKYIRENVSATELIKGCHFNAIVNNADFFCGHIYSDGGSTWWGTIQQRGGSIDTNNVYRYFSYGGADSVAPFSNDVKHTLIVSVNLANYAQYPQAVVVITDYSTGETLCSFSPFWTTDASGNNTHSAGRNTSAQATSFII